MRAPPGLTEPLQQAWAELQAFPPRLPAPCTPCLRPGTGQNTESRDGKDTVHTAVSDVWTPTAA